MAVFIHYWKNGLGCLNGWLRLWPYYTDHPYTCT